MPDAPPRALSDAERESLRAAWSEWAAREEFPRPPQLDRILAAAEQILADRLAAAAEAIRSAAPHAPTDLATPGAALTQARRNAFFDAAGLVEAALPPTPRLCDGCDVREPFEHRCRGEPCGCAECREERRLFEKQKEARGE